MSLDFETLRTENLSRVTRWHTLESWSIAEWALAMAGEAGECCNAVKKMIRLEGGIPGNNNPTSIEEAIDKIAVEIADTVIYADLLAQRIGKRLEDIVTDKFNAVSAREEFPERL